MMLWNLGFMSRRRELEHFKWRSMWVSYPLGCELDRIGQYFGG